MKKRGMIGRKSQVAIFLIAAAVIVLGGVLYFIYTKELANKDAEPVQPEVVPVKKFVEECIKTSVEDGFSRISLSGGYVEVPEHIQKNPQYHLSPGKSGFKMPYWYHDGVLDMPALPVIKSQLENFIREESMECLDSFRGFEGMYEITPVSDFDADVEFNENDVSVQVKYPMEVVTQNGDFKALVENFEYTHPIRFKKVYELAKLVMERQYRDYFLESKTIDLMSMDRKIPTTDIESSCSAKKWSIFEIRKRLSELLAANMRYVRIKGTDFAPGLYVPTPGNDDVYSMSYYQHHYIFQIDDKSDFRNFKAAFNYDYYPIDIYARPSESGILKSNAQKGQNMLSFLCLQIWHFTYDISYPVTAMIIDKGTSSSMEYRLNFAFKVEIDHNQPIRTNKGTSMFDLAPDIDSEAFCNDAEYDLTVFTVDNSTGEDIKDVNLTFACGRYYCGLGSSSSISLGAALGITRKVPFCFNAVIRGSKEGYAEGYTFAQTDTDNSYILFLNPLRTISNYRIVKHPIASPNSQYELEANEKATISLKEINGSFESFATYPLDSEFALELPVKNARYQVSIYIADNETLVGGYEGEMRIGSDITDASEIVFHAVSQESKTEEEAFLFVSSLDEHSKKVPSPEVK